MLHDDIQPKEVTEVAAKAGQQLPVPTQTQKHGETSKQVIAESATVVAPQTRQVNAVLQNQQFPVPAPRPLQRPNQVTTATTGGAPQIRQYQPQQLPIIQAPQSFPTAQQLTTANAGLQQQQRHLHKSNPSVVSNAEAEERPTFYDIDDLSLSKLE